MSLTIYTTLGLGPGQILGSTPANVPLKIIILVTHALSRIPYKIFKIMKVFELLCVKIHANLFPRN